MSQTPHPPAGRNKTRILIVSCAVLVAVVALLAFALTRGGAPAAGPQLPPTTPAASAPSSPSGPPTNAPASPSSPAEPSADPELGECTQPTEGFVPQRFTIPALDADEAVLALNLDEDGNIAAPPPDQPRTASWWSGGPKPGAGAGKAVLSIHTYNPSLPPALGNEMYAGGTSQLRPGDLIKLYGRDGQVQCYEYTHDVKVWVSDYDPDSDVLVDFEGDPQVAIIICWDYEENTRGWDSRVIFYGTPVAPAA
ncbi:class F sortase [Tessaracoccus lubricantis]|uniref:class F sortase n=1 Tax=Tessaracoccus lubricantis TaxID=545543 RepID=UPI0031EA49EC